MIFELPSSAELANFAALLAPGLIILGVRSRYKDGSVPELKDRALSYGIVSIAYFAAISPLFHVDGGDHLPHWLWTTLHSAIIPFVIGLTLAKLDQSELFYRVSALVGLRPMHHVPAAWDFAFSRLSSGTYILVTLHDGTQFAGLFGSHSFASSMQQERDLLIEQVWTLDGENEWKALSPERAVLLCGKDVRYIEVFK